MIWLVDATIEDGPDNDNSTKVSGPSWDEVVKKEAARLAFYPEIPETEKIKWVELISTLIKKTDNNEIVWKQGRICDFFIRPESAPRSRFLLYKSKLALLKPEATLVIDEAISPSLISDLYMAASYQDKARMNIDSWVKAVEEI